MGSAKAPASVLVDGWKQAIQCTHHRQANCSSKGICGALMLVLQHPEHAQQAQNVCVILHQGMEGLQTTHLTKKACIFMMPAVALCG